MNSWWWCVHCFVGVLWATQRSTAPWPPTHTGWLPARLLSSWRVKNSFFLFAIQTCLCLESQFSVSYRSIRSRSVLPSWIRWVREGGAYLNIFCSLESGTEASSSASFQLQIVSCVREQIRNGNYFRRLSPSFANNQPTTNKMITLKLITFSTLKVNRGTVLRWQQRMYFCSTRVGQEMVTKSSNWIFNCLMPLIGGFVV